MFGKQKHRERIAQEGTFARGQITGLKQHRMQDHRNTYTWEVTVRFTTADGRQVESAQPIEFLIWEPPTVGESAPLRYDPEEPESWVWKDNPPTPAPAPTMASSTVQVVNTSGADPTAVQAKLAAVRDQGLITRILGSI
jgi:hypothetical protein